MPDHLLTFSLSVFMGFFAIMNPIANSPIFLALVEDRDAATRKRIAKTATITAFLIVLCFVVMGKAIFDLFGLTIPAFKITGGLIVFYVGFEMLQSKKSTIHHQEDPDTDSIAVSPLAIPILAGPGTIVTAMNNVTNAGLLRMGMVMAIFGLMILLTYWAFIFGDYIVNKLGKNIIMVIGKIMGLILAVMGAGMAIEGIKLGFGVR